MSLRFNVAPIIHFDEDTETGTLRVEAIARHAGVLRYQNFDGTHRYEFVAPELNNARNPDGKPWVAQLAGATCTNEHPNRLIKNDTALREQVQVGEVEPEIEVYQDGRVKVFLNVWDSQTIDEIKRGDKRGISLGYECAVEKTDGIWKGQRFDAKQTLPISVDHAAIVRNPRAPEALIRSYARTDSEDGLTDIAWHCDGDEDDRLDALVDNVAALLERRDGCGDKVYSKKGKKKKPISLMDALETYIGDQQMNSLVIGGNEYRLDSDATRAIVEALSQHWDAPCGKGWVGTKPGCRRPNKAASNFSGGKIGSQSSGGKDAALVEGFMKKGGTAKAKSAPTQSSSKPVNKRSESAKKAASTRKEKQSLNKIATKSSPSEARNRDIMNKSFDLESKGGVAKRVAENVQKSGWARTKTSEGLLSKNQQAQANTVAKAKARNERRKAKKKTDSYSYDSDYGQRIYTRA